MDTFFGFLMIASGFMIAIAAITNAVNKKLCKKLLGGMHPAVVIGLGMPAFLIPLLWFMF